MHSLRGWLALRGWDAESEHIAPSAREAAAPCVNVAPASARLAACTCMSLPPQTVHTSVAAAEVDDAAHSGL